VRLRDALFVARTDLVHMLRQKETILWVFAMPLLFFYFIGTVTGGFGAPAGDEDRPDPLAVDLPADAGFVTDALIARLEEQNFAVTRPGTEEEREAFSRRLSLRDPETLPDEGDQGDAGGDPTRSLTDRVREGEETTLVLSHQGEGLRTEFDRFRVARAVYGLLADLAVLASSGDEADAAALRALQDMPRSLTVDVRPAGRRTIVPSGYEQTIPGTTVMFTMLVLLTSGSVLLVIEREQGLLRRLAATPISRGSVVLGKWSGKMALGLVQLTFAMAVGRVVFGVVWGPTLPMTAAVLFAWAACNASLGILLANVSRSEPQVAGIGVLCTMVLAALGGCWWPIEITPDWMQALAMLLPTGWTMDAMHRLVNFGDAATTALPHLLGLAALAFALGVASARTFRYQ